MRTCMVAIVLACVPSAVNAQPATLRPVAPASGVEGSLDARHAFVDDLGNSTLHAGLFGVRIDAHWSPSRAIELGLGAGARVSTISLDGVGSRTRAGLAPLRAWIGTGGIADRWSFGLRLSMGASFALVDMETLSSNGEHAIVSLEGAASHRFDHITIELRATGGAAYAGSTALSGIGSMILGADIGARVWSVRPYLAIGAAVATDLGWGGEALAGLTIGRTRAGLAVRPWRDASAETARAWISHSVLF